MASVAARWTVPILPALVFALVAVTPGLAQTGAGEVLTIIKAATGAPGNVDVALDISRATTFPFGVDEVVISRSDQFADALAAGVLLDRGPLLLTPPDGLPEDVAQEIQRLDARSAVILGGPVAVSERVEGQLVDMGLQVRRRQGPERITTSIDIARAEAPQATTAIITRASGSNQEDLTQGFADSLSAAGLASRLGWPILLTDGGNLTPAVAEYLSGSAINDVRVLGGTAAISEAVTDELADLVDNVERIVGPSRAGMALEVGKLLGVDGLGDTSRVVLVDGARVGGWAAAFAAAAHVAATDGVMLLADGPQLFPETRAFLASGAADETPSVTCIVHPLACNEAVDLLGLGRFPLIELDPPNGSTVESGQVVRGLISPVAEGANRPFTASGSCLEAPVASVADDGGAIEITLADSLQERCDLTVTINSDTPVDGAGTDQAQRTVQYVTAGGRPPGSLQVDSLVLPYDTDPERSTSARAVHATISTTCAPAAPDASATSAAMTAVYRRIMQTTDVTATTVFPFPGSTLEPPSLGGSRTDVDGRITSTQSFGALEMAREPENCTVQMAGPAADRIRWGLYAAGDVSFRQPLLLGSGDTAALRPDAHIGDDVVLLWVLEDVGSRPSLPAEPVDFPQHVVSRDSGVTLDCNDQPVNGLVYLGTSADRCLARVGAAVDVVVVAPGEGLRRGPALDITPADSRFPTVLLPYTLDATTPGASCDTPLRVPLGDPATVPQVAFGTVDLRAGSSYRFTLSVQDDQSDPGDDRLPPASPILVVTADDVVLASAMSSDGLTAQLDVTVDADRAVCVETRPEHTYDVDPQMSLLVELREGGSS